MNLQAKITTGVGIVLVAGGVALGFALSGSPANHAQPVDQPVVTDATTATVTESVPVPSPTDTVVAVTTPATVEAPVTQPAPVEQKTTDEEAAPPSSFVAVSSLSPGAPVPNLAATPSSSANWAPPTGN